MPCAPAARICESVAGGQLINQFLPELEGAAYSNEGILMALFFGGFVLFTLTANAIALRSQQIIVRTAIPFTPSFMTSTTHLIRCQCFFLF
jgi:hypothetical protein